MRILLDTHILLWAVGRSGRLDAATTDMLSDPANEILFSAVNIWEIAIKFRLGRPDLTIRPDATLWGLSASALSNFRSVRRRPLR
ncbi:MAG: type II toxin-antitoxin system VapC family toxin [Alphaproteobacteria bacterium]